MTVTEEPWWPLVLIWSGLCGMAVWDGSRLLPCPVLTALTFPC